MNTLSNVKLDEASPISSSVRLTPDMYPKAKSSKVGVSVEFVPSPDKKWFVLRATYGRVGKASDFLIEDGTYTYVAMRYKHKYVKGKKKRIIEPLIPNLFFGYATKEKMDEYVKNTPALSYLTYYYNHFEKDNVNKNPPLVISDSHMRTFIFETMNKNEHLLFSDYNEQDYKKGDLVEVKAGEFKGVVGYLMRKFGQQRVAVGIPGLGTIFTAYIPSAFIEHVTIK